MTTTAAATWARKQQDASSSGPESQGKLNKKTIYYMLYKSKCSDPKILFLLYIIGWTQPTWEESSSWKLVIFGKSCLHHHCKIPCSPIFRKEAHLQREPMTVNFGTCSEHCASCSPCSWAAAAYLEVSCYFQIWVGPFFSWVAEQQHLCCIFQIPDVCSTAEAQMARHSPRMRHL